MEKTARRTGINELDVWAAADAVLADGRRPTIDAVRQYLGRGSPNTVQAHLESWFAQLGKRLGQQGGTPASALPAAVTAAATHLWETAAALARDEAAAAATLEREALARERLGLEHTAAALAADKSVLEATRAAMDEALALAKAQLADAQRQVQALTERAFTLERHAENLSDDFREAQAAMQTERERAATAVKAHEAQRAEDLARHHETEKRWLGEVERARAEAAKIAKALAEAQAQHAAVIAKADALREDLEAACHEAQAQARAKELTATKLTGEVEALQRELAAARAKRPGAPGRRQPSRAARG